MKDSAAIVTENTTANSTVDAEMNDAALDNINEHAIVDVEMNEAAVTFTSVMTWSNVNNSSHGVV